MKTYTEKQTEDFLKRYIPVAKNKLVKNLNQALSAAKNIKYPVALKIISKQALHKSDIGGVRFAKNPTQFRENYEGLIKISKKKKLKLDGILVQQYHKGMEIIIGIKRDDTFGHVILFGLGGIFVEVLKDVSFRVCPITEKDVDSMINELRGKQILFGVRNKEPINLKLLKKALINVSKIPLRNKKIRELDINPFIMNSEYGIVADARMVTD